jgi:hypothetical protein
MHPRPKREAFLELFGRFEYAMKRQGFHKANRERSEADWTAFAESLEDSFFDQIQAAGLADTLINSPPGRLMRDGPNWRRPDAPLADTRSLFVEGVCRVRNSLVHGEKYMGDDQQRLRDNRLVEEAFMVLESVSNKLQLPQPPEREGG